MADSLFHPHTGASLLRPADPAAFTVHQAQGRSSFVLIADHAGQQVPAALDDLGLPQAELDQARRYAIGSLALSTASQAGLASTLSALTASGLGVEWLRESPAALARVQVDDVLEAAARPPRAP